MMSPLRTAVMVNPQPKPSEHADDSSDSPAASTAHQADLGLMGMYVGCPSRLKLLGLRLDGAAAFTDGEENEASQNGHLASK
ncbi:MAG: hypothetical protein KF716_02170 [Anaerolineae bacterium]|nr:hypothetical protein [Anaerolineae bacterium]